MDGLTNFKLPVATERASLGHRIAAGLADGSSVLIVSAAETAVLLSEVAGLLAASRTRVICAFPPLDLPSFMEQVTPKRPPGADAPLDDDGLEQGFAALTFLDPDCDRIALLVGDAHLLPHATLRYIDLVSRAGPHLQVALAGRSQIADTLALDGFAGLRRRLSLRMDLPDGGDLPVDRPPMAAAPAASLLEPGCPPASSAGALSAGPRAAVPRAGRLQAWPIALGSGVVAASLAVAAWALHVPAQKWPGMIELQLAPPGAPAERQLPNGPADAAEWASMPDAAAPQALPSGPPQQDGDTAPSGGAPARPAHSVIAVPDPVPAAPAAPAPADAAAMAEVAPVAITATSEALSIPVPPIPPVAGAPDPLPATRPPQPLAVRPERASPAGAVPVAQDGRRCRDIILRVQLGETPSDGDRNYLRDGCR